MKSLFSFFLLFLLIVVPVSAQHHGLSFNSSDTILNRAFNWAVTTALSYRGKQNDPVGPWYEGSLPGRDAFCIRDISHQCIGAQILGMEEENRNMFTKLASGISESRRWCTYWEINKFNKPAPVDYYNDDDFWYNLDANFDIVYALWRLYNWTGERIYISDPVFLNFYEKSLNQYISEWKLEPDSLLSRYISVRMNKTIKRKFDFGYGLPSYAESIPDLAMSTDLIAALYQGNISYAAILLANGQSVESMTYKLKAQEYNRHLNTIWWDPISGHFNTWYSGEGKFGIGEGAVYLLWFDALRDTAQIKSVINDLMAEKWNIENTSYFPYLFYKNGNWSAGYNYLVYCADPTTSRRDYPEVSFGVIEGIVQGLMGISSDASSSTVRIMLRSESPLHAELKDLQILGTRLNISCEEKLTTVHNSGTLTVRINAGFLGSYKMAFVGETGIPAVTENDPYGHLLSFASVNVRPGQTISISVK
jgi:hypothetical protein